MVTDELEQQPNDAIAIIGMAGRFPGADNVLTFWDNLLNGKESITFFTQEELLAEGIPAELLTDPDYVSARGTLKDIDLFDADFFGITPREAEITDPQHRLFMESCWEALEDAGYDPERYPHRIGVFAGESLNSYLLEHVYPQYRGTLGLESLQMAIGNDKDSLTTSVSYRMDLRGPSITVQTSSSTSLVAISLACQSLLYYQCDMALAGGAAVGAQQRTGYLYQEGGIMSKDGHCRAFSADSSGFVTGSGVGTVLLKRLEDAVQDQDHIYAVIRGFAINNDGSKKVSYAAPSVEGQAEVIAEAIACAGVNADTIGYVEAHGTGTAMGDPVEWAALSLAFGLQTNQKQFCAIGSVKTNIGHLDTAAGVAGLIKTALILKHGRIPATLHYNLPNPLIDMGNTPFYINSSLQDWPQQQFPRRAGVSSLGMGGTNAHVVLEQAPFRASYQEEVQPRLLLLSGRTATALESMAANLANYIEKNPEIPLSHVAYTLQAGRKIFEHRASLVCNDAASAVHRLKNSNYDIGQYRQGLTGLPPVVFMFSGQGTQYVGMGRGLYESEAVFRDAIVECSDIVKRLLGVCLKSILYPATAAETEEAEHLILQTYVTQPIVFAVGYATAQLWISRGVVPNVVMGHSIGEYVAACIAGVFSLEDALKVVSARGEITQEMRTGAMLAVGLSEPEAKDLLQEGRVSLAAVNSPSMCVLAGDFEAVRQIEERLEHREISYTRLRTSHAFHSWMMEPALEGFRKFMQKVELNTPNIPIVSNVTGRQVGKEVSDWEYWVSHLRQTVRFSDGVAELLQQPDILFLEVGAGETLSMLARQHLSAEDSGRVMSSIPPYHHRTEDREYALQTAGKLWCWGLELAVEAFHGVDGRCRIPLPTYPFERQRYWLPAQRSYTSGAETTSTGHRNLHTHKEAVATAPQESSTVIDRQRVNVSAPYVEPSSHVEKEVAALVSELLGITSIGIHDHFFELGGNSLLVTQYISRLQKQFNVHVSFQSFYSEPTVFHIAQHIEKLQQDTSANDEVEKLLIQLEHLPPEEAAELLQKLNTADPGGEGS